LAETRVLAVVDGLRVRVITEDRELMGADPGSERDHPPQGRS
jgi:hypothetical protein